MKNFICPLFCFVFLFYNVALAANSISPINIFDPSTNQENFTVIEQAGKVPAKKINFLLFAESNYQSLSNFGDPNYKTSDLLNFAHFSLSYSFNSRLEFGLKGQFLYSQVMNDDQISLTLQEAGFVNTEGFIKYNLFSSSSQALGLMAQVSTVYDDTIFYSGPDSGQIYSLSLLYERNFGSWLAGLNLGYIKRNPKSSAPQLAIFEPVDSTIVGSLGLSRNIFKTTKLSLELLTASHDIRKTAEPRGNFSAEGLVSLHNKFKGINISYGLGFGLTDGITVPSFRGFLGLQYRFGLPFLSKKTPVQENTLEEVDDNPIYVTGEDLESIQTYEEEHTEEPEEISTELTESIYPEEEIEGTETETQEYAPVEEPISDEEPLSEPEEDSSTTHQEPSPKDYRFKDDHQDKKLVLEHIEFDFDSSELTPRSRSGLDEVLKYLKQNEYTSIQVWGHTDFYGPTLYNEHLGLERAKAVVDYLIKSGIDPNLISYDGFGERRPLNTGISGEMRRKNRRVEIIVNR